MPEKYNAEVIFICQSCGRESLKWLGRCPQCEEWNTLIEKKVRPRREQTMAAASPGSCQELSSVNIARTARLATTLSEFDRVLGGGLVPGSLILISGDPGIGKSTLLLQVSFLFASKVGKVVYVSGEESAHQVKVRAQRLGITGQNLYLLSETNLETILGQLDGMKPQLAILDSIQTMYSSNIDSAPGTVGQVRDCTQKIMNWVKAANVPLIMSGHVTKDGSIAGPRILEHIVDVVLYLEGENLNTYRLLRGIKNRFGSTNEVGVFEMGNSGLAEIQNPSQAFISQRSRETVGSVIVPILEGSRPILVEIQALTNPTAFNFPRRTANGIDFNRLLLLVAVLGRRGGIPLAGQDVIVNVVGGIKIEEPAADLGISLAIASSFRNAPVRPDLAVIGEIGLSGETRTAPQMERRLNEAARLGFAACLVPPATKVDESLAKQINIIRVENISKAIRLALVKNKEGEELF